MESGTAWRLWAALVAALLFQACGFDPCRVIAKATADAVVNHWAPENVTIHYGNANDYKLVRKLGKGSFGEAYLGVNSKYDDSPVVVKIFIPTKSGLEKMVREVLLLQAVCGGPYVMKLLDVVREREGRPALVLEHVHSHDADVDSLYESLSPADVKFYMKQLLSAMAFIHQKGIIHRDIKFHNVLIDPSQRSLRVIDFGLSIFHTPGVDQSIAGTKNQEAPELLVSHHRYDTQADMWSVGAMLGALLLRRFPMFSGSTASDLLGQIVKVLGTEGLVSLRTQFGQEINMSEPLYSMKHATAGLHSLAGDHNAQYATEDALDLLDKILQWDPKRRFTAEQALQHRYFSGA